MMKENIYLKGHCFNFYGCDYQITDISYGTVRYAATKGGKVFRVAKTNFDEITRHNNFVWDKNNIPEKIDVSSIQIKSKRQFYVSIAIRELCIPNNRNSLSRLIPLIAAEIHDTSPPCAKTVSTWVNKFQSSGGNGLTDKRKPGNITFRFDPIVEQIFLEAIQNIYLQKERRSAIDVESYLIGRLIESGSMSTKETKIKIPTLRTIQRRIAQLDPYVVVKARQGEHAAQRHARSAGRTLHSYTALSIVQIDTHMLDIIVVDEAVGEPLGRPYLIIILDIATRMVVGYHLSLFPPSATTALAALRYMLLKYGIPAQIIPDNGAELKNTAFSRVCDELFISIVRAQARDPDGKAHIESFFRSLTYAITQKIPGTTFSNPTQRGQYDSKGNACFTVKEVSEFVNEWIHEIYHKSIHSKTGRVPELAWRDETKTLAPVTLSEAEVQILIRQPHRRNVHNGTVVFEYLHYTSHALAVLEGETVTVLVDELDLSFVYVVHPKHKDVKILAESTNTQYTNGLTIYEHRESLKIRNEMSENDLEEIGKYTLAYARYLLLERINDGVLIAKKWLKSIASKKRLEQDAEKCDSEEKITSTIKSSKKLISVPESNEGNQEVFTSIKIPLGK